MPAITPTDLNNAKTDVDKINEFMESSAEEMTTRLGATVPTRAGLAAQFPNAEPAAAAAAVSASNAASSASAAATSATSASTSATSASGSAGLAETAKTDAEEARDAALAAGLIFATTAKALSNGVLSTASLVGGSGGTNGTFALAFSGGGGSGAAGYFVVAGGAVTSITLTSPGADYTSAPTISFAASSGLTGASATAVIGTNVPSGEYFYVPSSIDGESLVLYKNNAGSAEEVKRYASVVKLSELLDVLEAVEAIGRAAATPPVTGAALSAGTYVFANPATYSGKITAVRAWGLGAATMKVRVFDKSGSTYTQSGSDTNVTLSAGLVNATVDVDIAAGQYIGFYVPASSLASTSGSAGITDSGGWYSGAGDVTNFTDSTVNNTLRLEAGFDVTYIAATAARVEAAEDAIVTLETLTDEHTLQLGGLPLASQIIGRPVTPITGSSLSAGDFVFADPVVADGVLRDMRFFSLGTATVKVKRWTRKNDTWTKVAEQSFAVVAGLQTVTVDMEVSKGEYIGLYNPSTTCLPRVVTTDVDSYGYFFTGSDSSSFSSSTRQTGSQLQVGFDIEFNNGHAHEITLATSDRIVVLGDSHVEDTYTIRGKSWISKLSAFFDWNFENFGVSGDDASEVLTRIRSGTLTFGTLQYERRAITYAWIYVGQNDAATYALSTFLENMRQLIETVRGLGAIPIISTQHTDTYGVGSQAIFRALCERYGAHFVDVTPNCRIMGYGNGGTVYAGFWGGTHHATRTNEEIIPPAESMLRAIGQPSQSLKVFRKRDSVSVATVADLLFDSHFERAQLFREVLVGQGALKVANEAICDEANTVTGSHIETVNSEYMTLQNGGTVALGDYSLIEVTMPVLSRHVDMVTLILSETAATVYVRNILGTLATGEPVGAWKQIFGSSGRYSLSKNQLRSAMRADKLSFLIYKSGGIAAFEQPRVEWFGESIPKPALPVKTEGKTWAKGSELLAATDLGSTTGWTVTGSLTAGTPTDGCLPRGATGRVTVDASNYLSQAFTYTQSTTEDREIEIRVRCRYFPAIVSSASPGTAQITQDSFDYRTLQIDVETAAGKAPYREKVGLWWQDVVLRTSASVLTTGMTVHVSGADGSIEVAYVSTKFVDA